MRVVITGIGAVTPLGLGVSANWSALCNKVSGIKSTKLLGIHFANIPSQCAAWIDERAFDHIDKDLQRYTSSLPKYIKYALVAAQEAISDSNLCPKILSNKMGTCIGTGMAPLDLITTTHDIVTKKGFRKVSPHFIPRILPNMAAGHVSLYFGIQGPLLSPSTACATGLHSIGEAFRWIKHGYCKAMIAGATEAAVTELSMIGFNQARALSTKYNENPEKSSRPFDTNRDGFVIGEGAGVMVLEEREHAINRKAKIYGEIVGYGCSGDAYHVTASHPSGLGAENAMRAALEEAGIESKQIDMINAHATSTPIGDIVEARAIMKLFNTYRPSITSNKGNIGHLLGGAGSVEAIFTILSIKNDLIPPTLNCESVDLESQKLNIVTGDTRKESVMYALKNSFGFGGTNVSICFSKGVE